MSDIPRYITLMGSEQVQNAAHVMREAADKMERAALLVEESNRRNQEYLEDWLMRFGEALKERGE